MTVESFLGDGAPAAVDASNPSFTEFANVFKHFQEGTVDGLPSVDPGASKGHVYYSDDEDEDEEMIQRAKDDGLTRRQRREASKLSVAELKQLVDRPEVVEYFDRDARDPRLLVYLKSYRNTVPVPSHWNAKRDYLAGRRGLEKTPYQLPRELGPVFTTDIQLGLRTRVLELSVMPYGPRRTVKTSHLKRASVYSQRWAKSISITKSYTTHSSNSRKSQS